MKGRRSVWSNEELIAATRDFVVATDEVWRLQRGTDAESRHFQKMADQGHYGGGNGTRQGIYVLTARGDLLASANSLNPKAILRVTEEGQLAWAKTTAEQRTLPDGWTLERRRWEDSYPDGGLVLRSFNADLGPNADRKRINRDHLWLTAEEARGWLPTEPAVGAEHVVAPVITQRLVQFHLVDNVRGQTLPFAREDVAGSRIVTRVVHASRGHVVFTIHGETKAQTDGTWLMGENDWKPTTKYPRGVTTRIVGEGVFKRNGDGMQKLQFVALGVRTGRTNLNGRPKDDVGPAKIGWVFELVPQKPTTRIAPAFVDVYDADWIVDPR